MRVCNGALWPHLHGLDRNGHPDHERHRLHKLQQELEPDVRGLHSSTIQLNLSHF